LPLFTPLFLLNPTHPLTQKYADHQPVTDGMTQAGHPWMIKDFMDFGKLAESAKPAG